MSIETDISDALTTATQTLATSLGLIVVFPNAPGGANDANGRYLEVMHFRNRNGNPTWGDERTLQGIWQIGIVDPAQVGEIPSTVIASQIIDVFAKNTKFRSGAVSVQINEHPTLLTMVQDGARGIFPVSVPYRVFEA